MNNKVEAFVNMKGWTKGWTRGVYKGHWQRNYKINRNTQKLFGVDWFGKNLFDIENQKIWCNTEVPNNLPRINQREILQ